MYERLSILKGKLCISFSTDTFIYWFKEIKKINIKITDYIIDCMQSKKSSIQINYVIQRILFAIEKIIIYTYKELF